jgi:hypothetical protein
MMDLIFLEMRYEFEFQGFKENCSTSAFSEIIFCNIYNRQHEEKYSHWRTEIRRITKGGQHKNVQHETDYFKVFEIQRIVGGKKKDQRVSKEEDTYTFCTSMIPS